MSPKYTAKERLKLIERVILGDEPVARVCRQAGISRVLFYRWLKKYKQAPGTPEALTPGHKTPTTPIPFRNLQKKKINLISPQEKLGLIKRVEAGEEVADVCREAGISRTIFYRWKKRYERAAPEEKARVLAPQVRHIIRYWRQSPEKYEQAILSLVAAHPDYGIRRLVANLPRVADLPLVGHHGVQNILRRHNLSLYEQRLSYAQAQVTPAIKGIAAWEQTFARFFAFSPRTRQVIIRFFSTTTLSVFVSVVVLGSLGYFATVFGQAAPAHRVGLSFATISLLVGMVFFLYSMKYYFTLALVLSFSTQGLEVAGDITGDKGELGETRGFRGFLGKIFGLGNGGNGKDEGKRVAAGGLQANLDHITLSRYPFISIHLPFYNESKVANRILAACTSMDYENYEVIVCDDSTDETAQIVKEWENLPAGRQGHPRVKVLHRPTREGFKGGALKYALQAMDPRTEFVVVFDADFVPYPDTLTQFMKYFKATGGWKEELSYQGAPIQTMPYSTNGELDQKLDIRNWELVGAKQEQEILAKNNIAVVAGYQWHVLNKSENWITRGVRTEYAGSYVIERPGQEILGAMKIIHGSVYCARADVLKHFGWGTSITEDYELTLRIYEKGFKVVFTPYIQAPSECVSTIKRLIRQRMRWAEGHSFNTRKMFWKLLVGRWEVRSEKLDNEMGSEKSNIPLQSEAIPASHLQPHTSKQWTPSPLTLTEKLEFLYLTPYYLQAALFLLGTFSWLISETVFAARLPFWTSLWGWSLVLTNFFALPLLNAVGLFLEESEEKDYLGLLSFVALCYIVVPFQAYAAVKGFIEPQEGPWFRTPKTGKITDIFSRGRFYRWLSGILPGRRPAPALQTMINGKWLMGNVGAGLINHQSSVINHYLALATANNRFNGFRVKPRRLRWVAKAAIAILLCFSVSLFTLAHNVTVVQATPTTNKILYIETDASAVLTGTAKHQLRETSSGTCDTGQTVRHAKKLYWIQIIPDTLLNTVDAGTVDPCPTSATGNGWIFDTPFETNGTLGGNFTFRYYFSTAYSANTGRVRVCAYRVEVSGGSLISSASLFGYTGTVADAYPAAGSEEQEDTATDPCGAGCTFNSTQKYLYFDFYISSNNGANNALASTAFGEDQCGTTSPRITIGSFLIPENLFPFLLMTPFIPLMVLWLKRRKERLALNL